MSHLTRAVIRHWLTRILQWLAEPQCCDELQLHRDEPSTVAHKKSG